MKMRLLYWVFILLFSLSYNATACFTVVAGKQATRDGSVMLGHNEDNDVDDLAGILHYPAVSKNNTLKSLSYTAIEMPFLTYADNMINEYGVTIVSNMCTSREDRTDLSGKGVGGRLFRHEIIRQANTAREAVLLVGKNVEEFGYTASGRTLTICDPDEAWIVALVKGRHWVAARVPDDEVACIANTYTIREVDLTDTKNFLGSKDIIEYAVKRGWYNTASGKFDFEKAYADRVSRQHPFNLKRQMTGITALLGKPLNQFENAGLPFSIKPAVPLTPEDIFKLLRSHSEPFQKKTAEQASQSPHSKAYTICNHKTNYSSVYQLRDFMPKEIGLIWWCAFWSPCTSPYLPIYPFSGPVNPARKFKLNQSGQPKGQPHAYRYFFELRNTAHQDFSNFGHYYRQLWQSIEKENAVTQNRLESKAITLWESEQDSAKQLLNDFSRKALDQAMNKIK